jgi:tRNA pseudouridine55 synthase
LRLTVKLEAMDGVIVVDKPSGWTSHDVVAKMRRLANTKKIGHLGTLDPMATGVLPLVIGRATRLAQFFRLSEKSYEGAIRFGYATHSYDATGEPTSPVREVSPDRDALLTAMERFRGRIQQTPPAVSAKKIGGVPAYTLARKNKPVDLAPVEITIHSFELLSLEGCEARVSVRCSSGTYLRSIAHDIGQVLGCGAHLSQLRRTASGPFEIRQAHTLEQLTALSAAERIAEALIPAAELLPEFPAEQVDSITEGQIRQGRDFRVSPFRMLQGSRYVRAISGTGALIAIGEATMPNVYHPVLVL